MNVPTLNVTPEVASQALKDYKAHRGIYDARDWEIERIYRQIARGKKIVSVSAAIRAAGFDHAGRPRLAFGRADRAICYCRVDTGKVSFSGEHCFGRPGGLVIPWPEAVYGYKNQTYDLKAAAPRIPPQHRPAPRNLSNYHLLWEADWTDIPRDPYLLKRPGHADTA